MIKNYFFKAMFAATLCAATAMSIGCSNNDDDDAPEPGPGEETVIEANYTHLAYLTADGAANYYLKLSTAELDQTGKAKGAGDIYYFDIYSTAPQAGAIRMPAASTYMLDIANGHTPGTLAIADTYKEPYALQNNVLVPGEQILYSDAKLVVTHSGNSFSVTAEITLKETGETIKLKSQAIAGIEDSIEIGDEVMMMGVLAEGMHTSVEGLSIYGLYIDGESEEDYVSLVFYGEDALFSDGLPLSTFTISPDAANAPAAGLAIPGVINQDGPWGCYYTVLDEAFAYFSAGEIGIEEGTEPGTYSIWVEAETEDGKLIMVEYEGAVDLQDGSQGVNASATASKPGKKAAIFKRQSNRILMQSRLTR